MQAVELCRVCCRCACTLQEERLAPKARGMDSTRTCSELPACTRWAASCSATYAARMAGELQPMLAAADAPSLPAAVAAAGATAAEGVHDAGSICTKALSGALVPLPLPLCTSSAVAAVAAAAAALGVWKASPVGVTIGV